MTDVAAKKEFAMKAEILRDPNDQRLETEKAVLSAVKLIRSGAHAHTVEERFLQHFPEIFDYGVHASHRCMVVELVGPSLESMKEANGTMAPEKALKLGIQCLEAIQGLHSLGFVHRG